jgi:hypothetical protein
MHKETQVLIQMCFFLLRAERSHEPMAVPCSVSSLSQLVDQSLGDCMFLVPVSSTIPNLGG